MIKTVNGKMTTSGDMPTIVSDFMSTCDNFIQYLVNHFECSKEKAIAGFSELIEIAKDGFIDYDEERECTRIYKSLDDLSEGGMNKPSAKMIVIEADSPEDAIRQVKEVLKDIMETEGDE